MPHWLRRRLPYVALAVVTMVIGLALHLHGRGLPFAVRDPLGDALWAMMMTWLVSVVSPRARAWVRGVVALAICFAVELSQLYHAPAIDALRGTLPGQLVLGSGFDPRDFVAYAAGVTAAVLITRVVLAPNLHPALSRNTGRG